MAAVFNLDMMRHNATLEAKKEAKNKVVTNIKLVTPAVIESRETYKKGGASK